MTRIARATVPLSMSLLALAIGAPSGSAHAEPPEPVDVRVLVVHATHEEGPIDPLCEKLKKQLQLMNFQTLKVLQRKKYKMQFGELGQMQLPMGRELRFVPISVIHRELHMQVEVPGHVNTRMTVKSRRGVLLGGIPYQGGVLLVHLEPSFRITKRPYYPSRAATGSPALKRTFAPADKTTAGK